MDDRQMRTLLAVADEGSFDKAATVLGITPSAVSQQVKRLEQRTGHVLMLRTHPVRLTAPGKVAVRVARHAALLALDALTDLGIADHGEPSRLAIAVHSDFLANWLLSALTQPLDSPRIHFELRHGSVSDTAEMLREGAVVAVVT